MIMIPQMSTRRLVVVTAGVMLALFLAAVELTVVGTAMPTIIAQLGGLTLYSWVFSAYMLTSTTMMPIFGRLSDLYGRRRIFVVGMALFLSGSALSGLSQSMFQLIFFRAIQGLGAGALLPLAFTIIGDIYSIEQRTRMQGLFSGVWGVASIVGPLLGGFLVDHVSWRWVFYINLPPGLITVAVLWWGLVESERRSRRISIDYKGAILLASSVVALLLALLQGGQAFPWLSAPILGLLALSLVSAIAFLWVERRAPEPIIPLDLFRHRMFSVASLHGFLSGMALFGSTSFIPLFVQGVIGTSATQAGATLTPQILGWTMASTFSAPFILRVGYRRIALTGMATMTSGAALLALQGVGATLWSVGFSQILLGAGMGVSVTALLIAVQNGMPRERLGIATSSLQFSRSIGGTVGVSLMGAVMTARLFSGLSGVPGLPGNVTGQISAQALVSQTSQQTLPPETILALRSVLANALNPVFLIALTGTALALVVATYIPRGSVSELAAPSSQLVTDS